MLKLCFIRGCRIMSMLALLVVATVFVTFVISPDINFMKVVVEHELKAALHTQDVDVEKVVMVWDAGPIIDMGKVRIDADVLSIHDSQLTLTYTSSQLLRADFSPSVALIGGVFQFNLNTPADEEESARVNLNISIQDAQVDYVYQHEKYGLTHVYADIQSGISNLFLTANELDLNITMTEYFLPQYIQFTMRDSSILPASLQQYVQGLKNLNVRARLKDNLIWTWEAQAEADKGLVSIEEAHFTLPFKTISSQGTVQLKRNQETNDFSLVDFLAPTLLWKDGQNYGDFSLHWSNENLHVEAADGSTSMPLLWSWLWMLGDDAWHDWLNSMQQGRVNNVRAQIDLAWEQPLKSAPTIQNLIEMKYHVLADGEGLDMALGLGGDFLYELNGKVLIDENHLKADVSHTVLKDGIATGYGKYNIDWHTLVMKIDAKGEGDVVRLHKWLHETSAQEVQWESAKATADLYMEWDAHKNEPNITRVNLHPVGEWRLKPKNIPMIATKGLAIWDFNRGLDIKKMQVQLPWLDGELTMFLDTKLNWMPNYITFQGGAPLAKLTDDFVLPITNPTGETTVKITYHHEDKRWAGELNLSANDWDNFAGYDKEGVESLIIPFSGKSVGNDLLPILISDIHSEHHDFSFDASVLIEDSSLDFAFKNVNTSAYRGDFQLYMPLDSQSAWSLDVNAEFMDKPVLTRYLKARGGSGAFTRPWSVRGHLGWVEWEKTYAQDVEIYFSSDKQSVGKVRAKYLMTSDAMLQNLSANFTLNGQGNYNLQLFEAYGAGQRLQASGSVQMQKDGALKWQGLALMDGEFGTLMEQAELDQLFKEGEMSGVFLGHGEFKDGEPWWRKMKGSFKLSVNDGRVLEGGTLTHLLAAISLVDLPKYLIFDRGDVVGEGLKYDKLQVEGLFIENKLNIDHLAFLSSALDAGGKGEVDLETGELEIILVARPWQNIEAFIGGIPGLGRVLTGEDKSLLRKVYRLHGPASDAAVNEIDAEEAGLPSGGYLEDLFTPSKWFEPKKKVEAKE